MICWFVGEDLQLVSKLAVVFIVVGGIGTVVVGGGRVFGELWRLDFA